MRKLFFLLFFFGAITSVKSQIVYSKGLNGTATTAKFRGTLSANKKLDLGGSSTFEISKSAARNFSVINNGNVGIGVATPLSLNVLGLPTRPSVTAFTDNAWSTVGNAGTIPITNFIGTSDDNDLVFKRNGFISGSISNTNTSLGNFSNQQYVIGNYNTGIGDHALKMNGMGMLPNSWSGVNTAVGAYAMELNTLGQSNVAIGAFSLRNNLTSDYNIAIGESALRNATGGSNVGIGGLNLNTLTVGNYNVGIGSFNLQLLNNGNENTAIGYYTGRTLINGNKNILIGSDVQPMNTTGSNQLNIGNWIYGNAGKIGIGVENPLEKLHIGGKVRIDELDDILTNNYAVTTDITGTLYKTNLNNIGYWKKNIVNNIIYTTDSDTKVGIGTSNPYAKLHVAGNVYLDSKVYIGTVDAQTSNYLSTYALAVNGSAIFTNAKVKLYGNWPDYVFDEKFKLMPLDILEEFIMKNKHLPDVPTSDDVQKNSIDLGENQKILLQKVEELTLYIIQLKKEIDLLKIKN